MRRAAPVLAAAAIAAALLASPASAMRLPLLAPTVAALPHELRAMVRFRARAGAPHSSSLPRFALDVRGFRVTVTGIGSTVMVEVERRRHRRLERAITEYLARGEVSSDRIAASFGGLGRIDVRFRPSGRVLKSKRQQRCAGPDRYTSRLGVFVGKIRFGGEGGYLSADAHRAKGRVRSPLKLHCRPRFLPLRPSGGSSRQSREAQPAFFGATWRHAVDSTIFLAARNIFVADGKALYLALAEHSAGRVAELHGAEEAASPQGFTFDDALTSASLRPTGPFAGTGLYTAAPDGAKAWTGSLNASFPGAPHVPLTGPQFETALEVGF